MALLLPGQGAQYPRMAAGLYTCEPVFTAAMDEVFHAFGPAGPGLRGRWLDGAGPLDDAALAQPLLFAVDYALGRLVSSWGAGPAALLGHSVGEMAAAALAGVFSVRDAALLVLDRVSRVGAAPPGGMLAVAASVAQVEPYLGRDVVVGAVNAPRHVVLAGPRGPLGEVADRLAAAGLNSLPVPSDTAFHSPVLGPALAGAGAVVARTVRRPPAVTVYSGSTAAVLRPEEALDTGFWARQPMEPVLFWAALDALLSDGPYLLVEAGPGRGLAGIARRHPAVRRGHSAVCALLPALPGDDTAERTSLRQAAEVLRAEGLPVPRTAVEAALRPGAADSSEGS
ncbi:acyltransferase domain-containing protein [Streptomyces sp. NBC_00249]|uniref:acyltransferase domain-containing protein n=1 Tax=Streptomyces sp. NBC_00249 TaxID=2975690 RepID=UPI0022568445|nr:acyltransferase domain-containing protein [Streptomyces sp. NBC_00249]MCX5199464.1 acyltransferase domain-containing protein [Streptomyces sp. NBC_00249]